MEMISDAEELPSPAPREGSIVDIVLPAVLFMLCMVLAPGATRGGSARPSRRPVAAEYARGPTHNLYAVFVQLQMYMEPMVSLVDMCLRASSCRHP